MNEKLVIIGAGGHGKVVADIAKLKGYKDIVFLDDNSEKKECGLYPIVGTTQDIEKYYNAHFIVGIGNNKVRRKLTSFLLEKQYDVTTLIHPSAVIDETVQIGHGTVIMANVVINADTTIGHGCIINTASSVDHDCCIQDYVHICPGVHIAGTVHIGDNTWIGIGSSVINNIYIVNDCMLGAGCVVVKDLLESGTYIGVPARRLK